MLPGDQWMRAQVSRIRFPKLKSDYRFLLKQVVAHLSTIWDRKYPAERHFKCFMNKCKRQCTYFLCRNLFLNFREVVDPHFIFTLYLFSINIPSKTRFTKCANLYTRNKGDQTDIFGVVTNYFRLTNVMICFLVLLFRYLCNLILSLRYFSLMIFKIYSFFRKKAKMCSPPLFF